jgi:hypothetical protein
MCRFAGDAAGLDLGLVAGVAGEDASLAILVGSGVNPSLDRETGFPNFTDQRGRRSGEVRFGQS